MRSYCAFLGAGEHSLDGSVGELLRIEVAHLGQAEDDVCKFEAGGFYGVCARLLTFWPTCAHAASKACPSAFTCSGSYDALAMSWRAFIDLPQQLRLRRIAPSGREIPPW